MENTLFDELTEKEIKIIENYYGWRFPPDLRTIIKTGFFKGIRGFPRYKPFSKETKELLNEPIEGILFDIKKNNFWYEKRGNMPSKKEERILIAKKNLENTPILIPIADRYISTEPNREGNPIISIHTTDIIYYGTNIYTYLNKPIPKGYNNLKNNIPFRTDFIKFCDSYRSGK